MTEDRGLSALAAALRSIPVPATYEEWQSRMDASYEADAAAILGERGVFLPDGRRESVRDAAIRLGLQPTDHGLPPELAPPAAFADDNPYNEIDTLRADLTLADTTAANLHDEIRKRDEAIATLRIALERAEQRELAALAELDEARAALEGLVAATQGLLDTRDAVGSWPDNAGWPAIGAAEAAFRAALATAKETP